MTGLGNDTTPGPADGRGSDGLVDAGVTRGIHSGAVRCRNTRTPERVMPAGIGLQTVTIVIGDGYSDEADEADALTASEGERACAATLPRNRDLRVDASDGRLVSVHGTRWSARASGDQP